MASAPGWARGNGIAGLTLRGWVTLSGGLAACAAAWTMGQRDLFWPGLFLVLLPLASWALLAVGGGRPRLTRSVTPPEVSTGDPVAERLRVRSNGLTLGAAVSYQEETSPALLGRSSVCVPVGFAPGSHAITLTLTPSWRGRHRLGPLRRTLTDGLGLARASWILPGTAEVVALPAVVPLAPLRNASGVGTSTDSALLKTSQVGSDDVLVREYRSGDDVRRIHWRSTARTGELMVRREERAWDPSAVVLVDNRASAYSAETPERRFEWLVSAAGSISVHLLSNGFSVSVSDTDTLGSDPAVRALLGAKGILRRLTDVQLSSTGTLSRALAAAPVGVRGQLLIALLGQLDDDDLPALSQARRDHRSCWAMIPSPGRVSPQASRILEAAGWRCVPVPAATSVAEAWTMLGDGAAG